MQFCLCKSLILLVLPERIELSTSPLPRECSTTELRQLGFSSANPILQNPICQDPDLEKSDLERVLYCETRAGLKLALEKSPVCQTSGMMW